jgi:hypothetical protein
MSTEQQPVDPRAVEETKQQIRGLVNEISGLTRQNLEPTQFYGEFMQRVVTALAAVGGAIWEMKDNQLRLAYQSNIRQAFPEDNGDDQQRHGRLLHSVMKTGENRLVPPYSGAPGDEEAGNPTSFLLVLAPVRDNEDVVGIIEIFQRPTAGPASQRGYLRFLGEMSQHVNEYMRSRKLQELTDWQSLFTEVDRFSRAVHEGLDPKSTAFTIANEGRRLIGCDRVSVALKKGKKCRVEAVSGQDTMDTRSNAVTLLGKLATAVMRTGEPLWFTGSSDDLPPQIEQAVQNYVDETHTKTVAVLPLRRPSDHVPDGDDSKWNKGKEEGTVIGTLIVEQIEDSRSPGEFAQSVKLVSEHSERALANAVEHNMVFLMPLWRKIGKLKWLIEARTLPKTLAALAGVILAILALVFIPYSFDMEATGTLQPINRQHVFVRVDGTIDELFVKHGDKVKMGERLAKLTNADLSVEYERIRRERDTAMNQFNTNKRLSSQIEKEVDRNKLIADSMELKVNIESFDEQLKLIREQQEYLNVSSPIDGEVVTWDVERTLLKRPVQTGSAILTIADTDPKSQWEIVADMEEDRMGHVVRAFVDDNVEERDVSYILKSSPGDQFKGVLRRDAIHDASQLNAEKIQTVRLLIDINEEDLEFPRPGTEVTIKVNCGKRSIGYVWFHELVEFLQSTILF